MSLCKVLEKIDKKKVKAVGISYDNMQYRYPPKDFFNDIIDIKNIKKYNTRKKYYNARRIPYNNFLNNHNYIQNKISYLSLFKNIFKNNSL